VADPRVTVVIATRDRREELERSLARHEAPVIVVDNGSSDGTTAALRASHPQVEVVALTSNRGAPARNLGVARASTPYVAFADDDSWWAPGALARAADVLDATPRLAVLAARVLVGERERLDPVCVDMAEGPLGARPDLPGPPVLGFLACGAVVRRDAFLAVGGFDGVVFFQGEEERVALDLAAAGWDLAYVPDVVAHHHPSARRDIDRRQVLSARNVILVALLRRPWPVVMRRLVQAWRGGRQSRSGLWAALARAPRALVLRKRLPAGVEAVRRTLDDRSARNRGSDPGGGVHRVCGANAAPGGAPGLAGRSREPPPRVGGRGRSPERRSR
jgi:GT2 family glycosyltransferase